jgi:two-component system, response regulator
MRNGPILVVDDNPDHVELVLMTLSQHRLVRRIVCARDGLEAADYLFRSLAAHPGTEYEIPSLVLLDLKLPRMDGFELLQKIRAEPALVDLPVVIVTSSDEDGDVTKGLRCGANSFVRKPIDFAAFSNYLDLIATYWLMVNEAPSSRSG